MDIFKIICIPAKSEFRLNYWIGTKNGIPIGVVQGGGADYWWDKNCLYIEVPHDIFNSLKDCSEKEEIKNNNFKIKIEDTEHTQYWGRDINCPLIREFNVDKQQFMSLFHFVDYTYADVVK